MKLRNVELGGIRNIVFNHKTLWAARGGDWVRVLEGIRTGITTTSLVNDCVSITHGDMMYRINLLKNDKRYRMWVYGDTLNVVRKGEVNT